MRGARGGGGGGGSLPDGLVALHVLVVAIVLVLDEVVEEARPRVRVVVRRQVVADRLREVQEHVPGVARDRAHARVRAEEREPAREQRRRRRGGAREDDPPEGAGDADRQRALAGVEREAVRPAVEVAEGGGHAHLLLLHALQPLAQAVQRVDAHRPAPADELVAREAAHRLRVEPPRQQQHAELLRVELQVGAEPLRAVGQDAVGLRRVAVPLKQGGESRLAGPRGGRTATTAWRRRRRRRRLLDVHHPAVRHVAGSVAHRRQRGRHGRGRRDGATLAAAAAERRLARCCPRVVAVLSRSVGLLAARQALPHRAGRCHQSLTTHNTPSATLATLL